ncbi:pirin family protein [Marinobacterium rhizophilum]|uniref:pirin family protein n=1 Tax=Marinobacterium rhizophilum TaxID=420402 RepID=UPI00036F5DDA|nr:pirin family protein [Marinobacterium rhizophilum]
MIKDAYGTVAPAQATLLSGRSSDLGAGLMVNRLLPQRALRMVGPWCFLDLIGPVTFAPGQGLDVAPHPHIGLQTVTWLVSGALLHKDSLGYEQRIAPGELNLMTAGAGIAHSEESAPGCHDALFGVQFWVALPQSAECCEPSFEHLDDLPRFDRNGVKGCVIMGSLEHLISPARSHSPLVAAEFSSAAGGELPLVLDPVFDYGLCVLSGRLTLHGEACSSQPLQPGEFCFLGGNRRTLGLSLSAGARCILLGGQPFAKPVKIWWNFVAHREETIRAALDDWNNERRFLPVKAYRGPALKAPPWPDNGRLK